MTKLSFSDVLAESFRFFFANIRLFFHLVTVPWIISLGIRVVGSFIVSDDDFVYAALIEKALDMLPTTMFLVAWFRVVLLGPQRLDILPGLGWTRRESAFLLHLIKVGGMTFALVASLMLMLGTLDPGSIGASADPETARRQAMGAPIAAGFIVSMLLALRVCYGLAATAVDVPFSPRLSWVHGRGHGWTIVGALFLIFFASALVTTVLTLLTLALLHGLSGPGTGASVGAWTVQCLLSYAGTAIAATAQAVIFRTLLGWREGTALKPA